MMQYNCYLVKKLFFSYSWKRVYVLKIPRNEMSIGELDPIWDIGLEKNNFTCFS